MNPICKMKDDDGNTISKINIQKSGFFCLEPAFFRFSRNFLDFIHASNVVEVSFYEKIVNFSFKNCSTNLSLESEVKKTDIIQISLYRNPLSIDVSDILFIQEDIYKVKMTVIDFNFKINKVKENLFDNEISIMNDS